MKKIFVFILLFSSYSFSKGQTWFPIGQGLTYPIIALDTLGGELYAGGDYFCDTADFSLCSGLLMGWKSKSWDTVVTYDPPNIIAMANYNADIYMGENNNSPGIIKWNGTKVSTPGNGINGYVSALTTYNGALYAGGQFTAAGSVPVNNIAQWNGTVWDSVSSGIKGTAYIYALTVYNGNLIAGGEFISAGGIPAKNIAQWNGSSWDSIGGGINGIVNALIVYNGNLYVGGTFDTAGRHPAKNIALWNGTAWNAVGSGVNGTVNAFTIYNGNLIAGGAFDSAGSTPANLVAQWNNTQWDSIGSGLTGNEVLSLTVYNGFIAAGGSISAGKHTDVQVAGWCNSCSADAVNEISNQVSVNLFPNPNKGVFAIFSSANNLNSTIEIYNMLGKKVYNETIQQAQSDILIDLSNQPAGIYLYRIISEKGNAVGNGKLVME